MRFMVALLAGLVVFALVAWGERAVMDAIGDKSDPGTVFWFVPGMLGLLTAYLLANLAGNRRVGVASADARTAALAFTAPPGKARLYVYREGFIGMAAGLNITLDGAPLSQLKSPRFLSVEVDAGRHLIGAAFGGLAAAQNNPAELLVDAQPGEVVAVRAGLSMGAIKNTVTLQQVAVDDALRRRLSRMKMVAAGAT